MDDADLRSLLDELYKKGMENDKREHNRAHKMLNLEPETAHFLNILLRSSRRKHLLEIGTSNGYSTIWLAQAVAHSDGQVTSIDRDANKQALADENLRRAGLRKIVELKCGDATEIVKSLPGPFDCVFFDADRYSAPAQLAYLLPKLTEDVILLADNILSHPEEVAGYLQALEMLPDFERIVLSLGKGLSLAYRANNRGLL
ncbi:O-methyltransferase [Ktedonospora formicarum]|uniref:O-methyltransferase n=1 Tax=Ktedonospora formicarum TaxID=2778364 RepID=A0A8J3MSN3_9CHLR|nr:class I SAM-dependent methyltransferase [Ktedonospora formicarum]GHO46300.1 O-methyltransferase [Ktedonospora formicarum]